MASVEPAARLVLPRLLRRVVRVHASLPGMGFRVPHGKTYVIGQEALLEIADRSELGFGPAENLPEDVILLERPSGEILEQRPRGEILLHYWELLFHARVHEEFQRLARQQRFGTAESESRLEALGGLARDEIRNVLRQERFLLPPYDDPSTVRRVRGRLSGHSLLPAVPDGQFLSGVGIAGKGGRDPCPGHRCGNHAGGDPPARHARAGGAARGGTRGGRGLRRRSAGNGPRSNGRFASARRRCPLGSRPPSIGEEVPAVVAAGRAPGRPRQPGGGRHSPCAGRVLGPPRAGCGSGNRIAGGSAWIGRSPANGPGHRRRGAAALARGPAGLGPSDAAGIVDGRGAAAVRPAKGLRRSGADDLDGRRDALDPVVRPPADPPRAAQPAAGARIAASAQRPAAAFPRADFRSAAAATSRRAGQGDHGGRKPLARDPSSQDRRHAGRRRPLAAEPAGADLPPEAGRRALGPDRGARLSHARRSPRRHLAEPAQGARLSGAKELPPRRRRLAREWPPDRHLGRRVRAGRLLSALDLAIQPSHVRHGARAVPYPVLRHPLRRRLRGPQGIGSPRRTCLRH